MLAGHAREGERSSKQSSKEERWENFVADHLFLGRCARAGNLPVEQARYVVGLVVCLNIWEAV